MGKVVEGSWQEENGRNREKGGLRWSVLGEKYILETKIAKSTPSVFYLKISVCDGQTNRPTHQQKERYILILVEYNKEGHIEKENGKKKV